LRTISSAILQFEFKKQAQRRTTRTMFDESHLNPTFSSKEKALNGCKCIVCCFLSTF
jgi:hypothetical protein